MGFRFQKRFRLSKLLRLNISKSGASISIGPRWLDLNIRGDKVMGNMGIPGTGIGYRERLDLPTAHSEKPDEQVITPKPIEMEPEESSSTWKFFFIGIVLIGIGYLIRFLIAG